MPTGTTAKARPTAGGASWVDQARAVPVLDVAEAVGLTIGRDGRSFGPCPGCGVATRANPGRTDRRGRCALVADGKGWHCYSNGSEGCEAKGDGLQLAAWALVGKPWGAGDAATAAALRDWYAGNGWCDPDKGRQPLANPRPIVHPRPTFPQERPPRPPAAEVAELWARCVPVTADPDAVAWLTGRTDPAPLDPVALAALDVVRALPRELDNLPRWASFKGQSWTASGHRLLVLAWEADPDAPGLLRVASLHARNVLADCPPGDKAAWPAGATAGGLLLANGPDVTAHGLPLVELAEGVPDWLRLVLVRAELDAGERPAVLGLWSGSADAEAAAIVPHGWTVAIRTHADQAGDKYAVRWAELLAPRGCKLHRQRKANPHNAQNGPTRPASPDGGVVGALAQLDADAGNPEGLALCWRLCCEKWGGAGGVPGQVAGRHRRMVDGLDVAELKRYRAELDALGGEHGGR